MHNAKAGGEIGANGEFYKGGQFVADTDDWEKTHRYVDQSFDARTERQLNQAIREMIDGAARSESIRISSLWKTLSEHVGECGEKISVKCRLEERFCFDGAFGCTTVAKFRDDDGNLLVWFASNFPVRGFLTVPETIHYNEDGTVSWKEKSHEEGIEWNIGDDVILSGTVKGHDIYNGEKQTTLTRCKLKAV